MSKVWPELNYILTSSAQLIQSQAQILNCNVARIPVTSTHKHIKFIVVNNNLGYFCENFQNVNPNLRQCCLSQISTCNLMWATACHYRSRICFIFNFLSKTPPPPLQANKSLMMEWSYSQCSVELLNNQNSPHRLSWRPAAIWWSAQLSTPLPTVYCLAFSSSRDITILLFFL